MQKLVLIAAIFFAACVNGPSGKNVSVRKFDTVFRQPDGTIDVPVGLIIAQGDSIVVVDPLVPEGIEDTTGDMRVIPEEIHLQRPARPRSEKRKTVLQLDTAGVMAFFRCGGDSNPCPGATLTVDSVGPPKFIKQDGSEYQVDSLDIGISWYGHRWTVRKSWAEWERIALAWTAIVDSTYVVTVRGDTVSRLAKTNNPWR